MQSGSLPQSVPSAYFEKQFGITGETIRKLLSEALSKGGDYADLYFQHLVATHVGLEDSSVNRASKKIDLGVGIRVLVGDQTGYAFSESLELGAMLGAARTAAAIASAGAAVPPKRLEGRTIPRHYESEGVWDAVNLERVLPFLSDLDVRARERDSLVRKVILSFHGSQKRILIVDSQGRFSFDCQPMTQLQISITMKKGGEKQSGNHSLAARRDFGFYGEARIEKMLSCVTERTRNLFDAKKPPSGEMPVVLGAGSSGILLHEAIGHGLEADFNRKGTSIFAESMGKEVASPEVTVVDSGIEEGLRGSINIDDEGNPGQKTVLVEKGVLRSYLHDHLSARHYHVSPTGNGRRQSFRHAPMPRMRNTYMLPGPHTQEEIIGNVSRGLYCITFGNGAVDIGGGDYTFYVKTGFLIEDGKLTAPIKDVNLIGNGPESLRQISMVADDLQLDESSWACGKEGQFVPVSLGQPTVLVSKVTVGGVGP